MIDHDEEAEICRRRALAYLGRPEASFLLRVAREFERLAQGQTHQPIWAEPSRLRQLPVPDLDVMLGLPRKQAEFAEQ